MKNNGSHPTRRTDTCSAGQLCAELHGEIKFEQRIIAIVSALLCAVLCGSATAMLSAPQEDVVPATMQTACRAQANDSQ